MSLSTNSTKPATLSTNHQSQPMHVVICGGGIIGCCTAYYLSQHSNISVTIIERCEIACAASGKAAGILPKEWCNGTALEPLAKKSFTLHQELGNKFGNEYLYKTTNVYSMTTKYKKTAKRIKHKMPNDLQWLDNKNIINYSTIGTHQSFAQIHPKLFCNKLIQLCIQSGNVQILHGIVQRMIFDKKQQKVIAVQYMPNKSANEDANELKTDINMSQQSFLQELKCDFIVIAMGPWSNQAYHWFPKCKQLQYISGEKYNSIVVQPTYESNANVNERNAIFHNSQNERYLDGLIYLQHYGSQNMCLNAQIHPRPDGTLYCVGSADQIALPSDPLLVTHDERYSVELYHALQELSTDYLLKSRLLIKQACYLPTSSDNIPLIGKIHDDYDNAFLGCGHTRFGILTSPATGLLLSEMIICCSKGEKVSCSWITDKQLSKLSASRPL